MGEASCKLYKFDRTRLGGIVERLRGGDGGALYHGIAGKSMIKNRPNFMAVMYPHLKFASRYSETIFGR